MPLDLCPLMVTLAVTLLSVLWSAKRVAASVTSVETNNSLNSDSTVVVTFSLLS